MPDHTAFVSRLQWIARECGGVRKLAEKSQVSRGSLENYLTRGGEPSRPHIVALANTAGVRVAWLVTGEEPMKADSPDVFSMPQELEDPYVPIPMINIGDIFKDGSVSRSPHMLVVATSWLRSLNHSPEFDPFAVRYWRVEGNSMAPDFRDGDYVLLDPKRPAFLTSGTYLFAINRDIYLNYIWPSGPDKIEIARVRSEDPRFSMTRADFDQKVVIAGRVFGKVGEAS